MEHLFSRVFSLLPLISVLALVLDGSANAADAVAVVAARPLLLVYVGCARICAGLGSCAIHIWINSNKAAWVASAVYQVFYAQEREGGRKRDREEAGQAEASPFGFAPEPCPGQASLAAASWRKLRFKRTNAIHERGRRLQQASNNTATFLTPCSRSL